MLGFLNSFNGRVELKVLSGPGGRSDSEWFGIAISGTIGPWHSKQTMDAPQFAVGLELGAVVLRGSPLIWARPVAALLACAIRVEETLW